MSGSTDASCPRVLVVEDDELIAPSLEKALKLHGFEPEISATVSGALDRLSTSGADPFAHIVLDLLLPDADGENVLAYVERMQEPPHVVVVASPVDLNGYRVGSLRGRCDLLPKPILFDQLLRLFTETRANPLTEYARAFALSPQECAVIEHAVCGEDDDEIGDAIGCARTTVKSYWLRIYRKVGERRRDHVLAHVARWLIQRSSRGPVTTSVPPARLTESRH